jgi:transglutaminase-like putative cysteine protease
MKRLLRIEHETVYAYARPVALAHHQAFLRPLDDGRRQRLEAFELVVDPPAAHPCAGPDAHGNERLFFSLHGLHRELRVRATSRVRVAAPPPLQAAATPAWEAVAASLRFVPGRAWVPAGEFCVPSPYVPRLPALRTLAEPAFTPGRPLAGAAIELMHRLHREWRYERASTSVDTPLAQVLAQRRGVCQDFAHLMIGALRAMGQAARYVSGYLLTHTEEGAPLQGAEASHAWVALYCPGVAGGWLELDPTNDLLPGTAHVRVALGRDYGDVTPLKGVIRGGGAHTLQVRVKTEQLE